MPKVRRSYYADNEIIATVNDLYSRGYGRNKSQVFRRVFKAGIDRLKDEGPGSLPPDKPRRHEDLTEFEERGQGGSQVDGDNSTSNSRSLPRSGSVGSAEDSHSRDPATQADEQTSRDEGGMSRIFPWIN